MQTPEDGKEIWEEKFVDQKQPGRRHVKIGNCQIGAGLLHITAGKSMFLAKTLKYPIHRMALLPISMNYSTARLIDQ